MRNLLIKNARILLIERIFCLNRAITFQEDIILILLTIEYSTFILGTSISLETEEIF